jgi:hypothetical protein
LISFQVERHYQLPTPPSHGHGIVLLTSWSSAFIAENLVSILLKLFFFVNEASEK